MEDCTAEKKKKNRFVLTLNNMDDSHKYIVEEKKAKPKRAHSI